MSMNNRYPDLLNQYIAYAKDSKKKNSHTIQAYTYDLVLFLKYMVVRNLNLSEVSIEVVDIADIDLQFLSRITVVDLIAYLNYISNKRSNGEAAKARKISSLKSFYHYLVNIKRVLDQDPCLQLEMPKVVNKSNNQIELVEVISLIDGISGKHQFRDKAIISLFLYSSLKINELIDIKLEDIDLENDVLRLEILGNGMKEIILQSECKKALSDYIEYERTNTNCIYLFLSQRKEQIRPRTIQHLIKVHVDKNPEIQDRITSQHLKKYFS